jgi:hypothetical protein
MSQSPVTSTNQSPCLDLNQPASISVGWNKLRAVPASLNQTLFELPEQRDARSSLRLRPLRPHIV